MMMTTLQTTRPSSIQPGSSVRTDDATVTDEIPVLEMVGAMLGFPERDRFALIRLDDEGIVCALRAVDEPDLRFIVVPPGAFFTDYTPEIDDETAAALGATSAEDLLVLVMVNTADSAESATANLLAPVVINHRTRRAAQVVLHDDSLSLRAPLVQASAKETQPVR
jgi:flagellar assembly factor FliW